MLNYFIICSFNFVCNFFIISNDKPLIIYINIIFYYIEGTVICGIKKKMNYKIQKYFYLILKKYV